jgi:hypothetical protein
MIVLTHKAIALAAGYVAANGRLFGLGDTWSWSHSKTSERCRAGAEQDTEAAAYKHCCITCGLVEV